MRASVCICTFNGERRIGEVLRALAAQDAARELWEVIVIDNASTDATAAITSASLAQLFPENGRLVSEPNAGLQFARRRAAIEARGDVVCFLDDDNLAAPDFVRQAIAAFDAHPRAGLLGGKVLPEWETEPTPLARAVATFALAICDAGDQPFVYEWIGGGPVGAGMCIRRELLRDFCDDTAFCAAVHGRRGGALTSGDDHALSVRVFRSGFERRYEPKLVLRHQIPPGRMQKDYLLRLYEGIGRGQASVRRLWARQGNSRLTAAAVGAKDFALWLRGALFAPAAPAAQNADISLRRDLHDLDQRLLRGRVAEALEFAFRPR